MRDITDNVRAAAAALGEAIEIATAAGYRVDWPLRPAGLIGIAISETGRVQAAVAAVPTPTPDVVIDVAQPQADPDAADAPVAPARPASPAAGARRNRA